MGFGVNEVTGDYSRGAVGLWIRNGELAFPVAEVTIAGNLIEMLKGIEAVRVGSGVSGVADGSYNKDWRDDGCRQITR